MQRSTRHYDELVRAHEYIPTGLRHGKIKRLGQYCVHSDAIERGTLVREM
jgi:hypothetical protein